MESVIEHEDGQPEWSEMYERLWELNVNPHAYKVIQTHTETELRL